MQRELTHWNISYLVGREQMYRLAHALLHLQGQLLDSAQLPNYQRDTFHVRIALPPDKVETFRIMTGFQIEAPLKPNIGKIVED